MSSFRSKKLFMDENHKNGIYCNRLGSYDYMILISFPIFLRPYHTVDIHFEIAINKTKYIWHTENLFGYDMCIQSTQVKNHIMQTSYWDETTRIHKSLIMSIVNVSKKAYTLDFTCVRNKTL